MNEETLQDFLDQRISVSDGMKEIETSYKEKENQLILTFLQKKHLKAIDEEETERYLLVLLWFLHKASRFCLTNRQAISECFNLIVDLAKPSKSKFNIGLRMALDYFKPNVDSWKAKPKTKASKTTSCWEYQWWFESQRKDDSTEEKLISYLFGITGDEIDFDQTVDNVSQMMIDVYNNLPGNLRSFTHPQLGRFLLRDLEQLETLWKKDKSVARHLNDANLDNLSSEKKQAIKKEIEGKLFASDVYLQLFDEFEEIQKPSTILTENEPSQTSSSGGSLQESCSALYSVVIELSSRSPVAAIASAWNYSVVPNSDASEASMMDDKKASELSTSIPPEPVTSFQTYVQSEEVRIRIGERLESIFPQDEKFEEANEQLKDKMLTVFSDVYNIGNSDFTRPIALVRNCVSQLNGLNVTKKVELWSSFFKEERANRDGLKEGLSALSQKIAWAKMEKFHQLQLGTLKKMVSAGDLENDTKLENLYNEFYKVIMRTLIEKINTPDEIEETIAKISPLLDIRKLIDISGDTFFNEIKSASSKGLTFNSAKFLPTCNHFEVEITRYNKVSKPAQHEAKRVHQLMVMKLSSLFQVGSNLVSDHYDEDSLKEKLAETLRHYATQKPVIQCKAHTIKSRLSWCGFHSTTANRLTQKANELSPKSCGCFW